MQLQRIRVVQRRLHDAPCAATTTPPESGMSDSYDIAVIGAGGAGTMAYLRAVLNHDRTILFTGDAATKKRGRATWVADVDNIPGMHDVRKPITSTTKSTLKWLGAQESLRDVGTVVAAQVTHIDKEAEGFRLHYSAKSESKTARARYVILATGLMDVQPLIGGSMDPIFPYANRGDVLYCVRCDGHRTISKPLSVIGRDEDAVWIAGMMHERYGHQGIAILGNGTAIAPSAATKSFADAYGFKFYAEPIVEVMGDPKGAGLSGYRLEGGLVVETMQTIVSLGTIVYNQLLKELGGELNEAGRVIVSDILETSVSDVFAVGDMVAGKKLQIYTAWDEAVDAADAINKRLRATYRKRAVAAHQAATGA